MLKIGGVRKIVRYTIHGLNVVNLGTMIGIFCALLFQCRPITKAWDPSSEGTCNPLGYTIMVQASLNIALDVLTLALPFWLFISLKMPRKRKIYIITIFVLGIR